MRLPKTHRVSKFKKSDWLKKFVDFSTDKRKNAPNSFEKDVFKLIINAVFGKTMENLRKRISVSLIDNAIYYVKFCFTKNF